MNCPICGTSDLEPILRRSGVPVLENTACETAEQARSVVRGDIDLVYCSGCQLVFNRSYEASKVVFDTRYDPAPSGSAEFSAFTSSLVKELILERGVRNAHVVDVGCGKGDFLRALAAFDESTTGEGFDATYDGPAEAFGGRLRFHQRYLRAGERDAAADVVVSRQVIYYLTEPVPFLRAMREVVQGAANPKAFVECRDVRWPLARLAFWDFPYESLAYYSECALAAAMERAGFAVERIDRRFGGQYLLAQGVPARGAAGADVYRDPDLPELIRAFREKEAEYREAWQQRLVAESRTGGVALWGAGARGVAMAYLTDPQCELLRCLVDVNPHKNGRYVPGSGHPIVSPGRLSEFDVHTVYLTNPLYRNEVERMVAEMRLPVRVDVIAAAP